MSAVPAAAAWNDQPTALFGVGSAAGGPRAVPETSGLDQSAGAVRSITMTSLPNVAQTVDPLPASSTTTWLPHAAALAAGVSIGTGDRPETGCAQAATATTSARPGS